MTRQPGPAIDIRALTTTFGEGDTVQDLDLDLDLDPGVDRGELSGHCPPSLPAGTSA